MCAHFEASYEVNVGNGFICYFRLLLLRYVNHQILYTMSGSSFKVKGAAVNSY